jgi:hypothetical protein
MVGTDHHLDTPGVMTPTQLGVADQRAVARFPGDEAGEAGAASVDEVQPLVLAEGIVAVGDEGLLQELRHLGDVGLAHPALDLDGMHGAKLALRVRRPRPRRRSRSDSVL